MTHLKGDEFPEWGKYLVKFDDEHGNEVELEYTSFKVAAMVFNQAKGERALWDVDIIPELLACIDENEERWF
jgi:hypothetical protein